MLSRFISPEFRPVSTGCSQGFQRYGYIKYSQTCLLSLHPAIHSTTEEHNEFNPGSLVKLKWISRTQLKRGERGWPHHSDGLDIIDFM